MDRRGLSSWQV